MKLTEPDIQWLSVAYPSLRFYAREKRVAGEINIAACFDAQSGLLMSERCGRNENIRRADNFIQDVFEIEIRLDSESMSAAKWPKVYETGGRVEAIAEKWKIPKIDLHLYGDDSFCLGITYGPDKWPTLRAFIWELVVPCLYRLAYVDRFGVEAARRDLWGEYSHGPAGYGEYEQELMDRALRGLGRNDRCPCGSGKKYKKCCWDEDQAGKQRVVREKRTAVRPGATSH